MKPGYGAKSKKKSKRKQQKKGGDDGDVSMRTADDIQADQQQAPADTSAKNRLVERLEHKKALKLKVQSLKSSRTKLTKLPAGNARRREYSQLIKQAVEEFTSTSKQKAAPSVPAAAEAVVDPAVADAGDSRMVE